MKFQLLIKIKIPKNNDFSYNLSDSVLILLINVKIPTIYEQDQFFAQLSMKKSFITSRPGVAEQRKQILSF